MKRLLPAFVLFCCAVAANAQGELSVFTATGRGGVATTFARDYQAIGINPANLGWGTGVEGKKGAFTFSEGAYSLYSEALTKPELRTAIRDFDSKFTLAEKQMAADNFANTDFSLNLALTPFAIAYMNEKVGGFAFSVRERVQWYSRFNQDVSEILFMGKHAPYFDVKLDENDMELPQDSAQVMELVASAYASQAKVYSELFEGSTMTLQWSREYSFSYGRHVFKSDNLEIHVGAGVKYVTGLGILEVETIDGEFQAYSSISPFAEIDYGPAAELNPSTVTQSGGLPKAVGRGWGFDFGGNVVLFDRLRIGASITDIGSVTWDGNVYVASDDTLVSFQSGGFDSYNIFAQAGDIVGDQGLLSWSGATERVVSLPTAVRIGASMELIEDRLEVGADLVIPGNDVAGNYDRGLFGLGGEVVPIKGIHLSAGISYGGNYDFNLPVGIVFRTGAGSWEAGIASRDAITFFSQNRPTLSLALGFARFRF